MNKNRADCVYIFLGIIGALVSGVVAAPQNANAERQALSEKRPAQIIERGAHHRKWAYVTSSTGLDGRTVLKTNRYTEIGTGLHYQRNGEWVESKAVIDIVPGGALASQGPHQVGFAANINTPGAINLLTPDGKRLRSHVLGLAYTDARTGQSVLIAQVQDSVGMLVSDNQIIYPNAFDDANAVKADIRYTYTTAGFEQDIILRADPPGPELFGLDPATTRLEVFTEFVEAPQPTVIESTVLESSSPEQRGKMVWPDFVNQTLGFGAMRMDVGAAFPIENSLDLEQSIPTGKTWELREGRTFLIEAVLYPAIKPEIEKLPPNPPGRRAARTFPKAGSNRSFPPPPVQARKADKVTRMASAPPQEKGYVIDYSIVTTGLTNFTFAADTTYYINAGTSTRLYGTTSIEGGAVIKFTNSSFFTQLHMINAVDCRTSPYRPAIYTSMHDNTVGDIIANSTGKPTNYCGYMVYFGASAGGYFNVHDLRVKHAERAFYGTLNVKVDISNCQVSDTRYAFKNNTAIWNLRNILVHRAQNAFDGAGSHTNNAEHITFHTVSNFLVSGVPAIKLTNSLLIGVTNASYVGSGVETNLSDAGIFQTVGAGAHYLAEESAYRNAGTTNISAGTRTAVLLRTTYPPLVLTNSIVNGDLTLIPAVQRDTDTPDLGYHYDPIDYAVSGLLITNATLRVEPGTAIAVFNPTNAANFGFGLTHNAKFQAAGRADSKVVITHYSTVQEMANTNWNGAIQSLLYTASNVTGSPELRCRFTDFTVLGGSMPTLYADNTSFPWHLTDCQFHGGAVLNYGASSHFTNSLFNRSWTDTEPDVDVEHYFANCTSYGGWFIAIPPFTGNYFHIRNTLFSDTSINVFPDVINTNIAYFGSNRLIPTNSTDVILASMPFQTGSLGYFYISTNSALIDGGGLNATNAGLYHYTMLTNNVKETNTMVDIGFHYVATDANGAPLDYDGDGIPDYWEDTNGNGFIDSGETDWMDAADLGLRVYITRPRDNSIIP